MFSVEYFNNTVYISTYNIRRINFLYYDKLRKLITAGLKQTCKKIVLNLLGVRMIDKTALEMLKLMRGIASNLGVQLVFINVDEDLKIYIHKFSKDLEVCFSTEGEYKLNSR